MPPRRKQDSQAGPVPVRPCPASPALQGPSVLNHSIYLMKNPYLPAMGGNPYFGGERPYPRLSLA
ncbi:hypothetical protein FAK_12860 [Desulfoferula mesophila]|uniref:Uncharacterized protein n=1 Tax=Desulfoferula mesophila TaxID=3058419 RepID=A0AAU9EBF7_9BACT|nr:hypothetical protein FAK_12860 [Desulfoferula mesophilus]